MNVRMMKMMRMIFKVCEDDENEREDDEDEYQSDVRMIRMNIKVM